MKVVMSARSDKAWLFLLVGRKSLSRTLISVLPGFF